MSKDASPSHNTTHSKDINDQELALHQFKKRVLFASLITYFICFITFFYAYSVADYWMAITAAFFAVSAVLSIVAALAVAKIIFFTVATIVAVATGFISIISKIVSVGEGLLIMGVVVAVFASLVFGISNVIYIKQTRIDDMKSKPERAVD